MTVVIPDLLRRAMELRGVDPDEVAAQAAEVADSGVLDEPERPPAAAVPPAEPQQESLLGVMEPPRADEMSYEDFFTAEEVATFKRVKRGSMSLARVARGAVAEMVGGTLEQDDSHKEYLTTRVGRFRLAMGHNSDNETEMREHARLGAEIVSMGSYDEMRSFFARHGSDSPDSRVQEMRSLISVRLPR